MERTGKKFITLPANSQRYTVDERMRLNLFEYQKYNQDQWGEVWEVWERAFNSFIASSNKCSSDNKHSSYKLRI
jgi:hypothetical protein